MSFKNTAYEIIDRSIKSMIYIDDKIAIPFKADETNSNHKLCSELYESFDKNNTIVKFYEFNGSKQWDKDKSHLFQSRDLLVLDWKLDSEEPKYKNALPILNKAVQTENIYCVVIYTDIPEKEQPDIQHNICCYFSDLNLNTLTVKPQIEDKIEEWATTKPTLIIDSLGDLKTLVISPNHAGEMLDIIRTNYTEFLGNNFIEFETFLKELFGITNLMETYKTLGYVFNYCVFPPHSVGKLDIEVNDDHLLINNTYIFVERKIEPKQLYFKIRQAITSTSNNFLPIMGLEMRNAFNDSSAIITKKLSSIDEYAFLHHQDSVKPKEAFYEFLKELWKDQSFHFLKYDNQLKIFDELGSYRRERKILKSTIKKKIINGELDKDLGRLNCFYNLLVTSKEGRNIGFGDIFRLKVDDNNTDRYLLCITAHCDCLYPAEKLNNNFYFIEGNKDNITNGLKYGDEGFNSFIEDSANSDVICIMWKDKPITIYVPNENNNINTEISINIGSKEYTACYKVTLKENYAQRMANRAFTYPLHVGIFFANKKRKKKKK